MTLLAGPAATGALVLWLWVLLGMPPIRPTLYLSKPMVQTWVLHWPFLADLLRHLFYLNLGMLIFNLLPAFPLDGGRTTRILLRPWLGDARAVAVIAFLGMIVGLWSVLGSVRYGLVLAAIGVTLIGYNLCDLVPERAPAVRVTGPAGPASPLLPAKNYCTARRRRGPCNAAPTP